MSDKYNLLAKHFLGETSVEEEQEITLFKQANPKEYQVLAQLWKTDNLQYKRFDSKKAWKTVAQKASKTKIVPMYSILRKVAAVAAIFLLTFVVYTQFSASKNATLVVVEATEMERNKKIALSDGTIVYLNKHAKLSYPKEFANDQRTVTLEGEAFFEVAKETNRPFRITTNHSEVEVLGTSFNINTQAAQTEVAVATGKVKVQSLFEEASAILMPNNSALITQTDLTSFPTANQNYLAWQNGKFTFRETAITTVIKDLNTYYPNQIILNATNSDCLLNASFDATDLSEILEIIQTSCALTVKKNEQNYELN